MATSSITHNFVVSNPNSVKRFVAAIDEADRDRTPKQTLPGRQLTNNIFEPIIYKSPMVGGQYFDNRNALYLT